MAKDKTVITYLRRGTASTRRIQGRAMCLETPLPETPENIEKNNIESFSERKRKRTTIFSGFRSGGDSTRSATREKTI